MFSGRASYRLCRSLLDSCLGEAGAVLEVVLQDFCGQCRAYGTGFPVHRTHDLTPADYFCRGQSGDFRGSTRLISSCALGAIASSA